jgi:hypothetical protein
MAIALHFSFREHWQELKRGRPGRRFQDRYDRARSEESRGGPIKRIALIGLAIVCLAIGVVLAVMPGPAVLFFFLAGGLLATESRIVARLMDWLEVRLRKIIAWCRRRWRRLSTAGRVIVAALATAGTGAFVYLSYQFIRG